MFWKEYLFEPYTGFSFFTLMFWVETSLKNSDSDDSHISDFENVRSPRGFLHSSVSVLGYSPV